MTKKYFDTPSITLVRMTADVIATSTPLYPGQTGNGIGQAPGRASQAGRQSIWD